MYSTHKGTLLCTLAFFFLSFFLPSVYSKGVVIKYNSLNTWNIWSMSTFAKKMSCQWFAQFQFCWFCVFYFSKNVNSGPAEFILWAKNHLNQNRNILEIIVWRISLVSGRQCHSDLLCGQVQWRCLESSMDFWRELPAVPPLEGDRVLQIVSSAIHELDAGWSTPCGRWSVMGSMQWFLLLWVESQSPLGLERGESTPTP